MPTNIDIIRLANTWLRKARNSRVAEEAAVLTQCANDLTSLINENAIDAKVVKAAKDLRAS